jgi:hypothetical protein
VYKRKREMRFDALLEGTNTNSQKSKRITFPSLLHLPAKEEKGGNDTPIFKIRLEYEDERSFW